MGNKDIKSIDLSELKYDKILGHNRKRSNNDFRKQWVKDLVDMRLRLKRLK